MKKRTLGLLLFLAVGTLLTGCGSSTESRAVGTYQSDSLYQSDGTNSQTAQTEKLPLRKMHPELQRQTYHKTRKR